MLAPTRLIDKITQQLSALSEYLKLKSAQNLNDESIHLEDFLCKLLNLAYGYDLTNLNERKQNAPVVDLDNAEKRIGFQITIDDTGKKIRETSNQAVKYNLSTDYDTIFILFFVRKAPFRPSESANYRHCENPAIELMDISRLIRHISSLSLSKIREIISLLDEQILSAGIGTIEVRKAINNIPLSTLGDLFKGRSDFLKHMRECLVGTGNSKRPIAICALGGVGKTRTAVEYAWSHQENYECLFFLSGTSPQSLNDGLLNLHKLIDPDVSFSSIDGVEEQHLPVYEWLQIQKDWLIIIDNVDNEQSMKSVIDMLPRLSSGHVCITTRLSNWPDSVLPLDLDVLTDSQGAEYILEATRHRREISNEDESCAMALSSRLGGLILALEHSAAYIRKLRYGIRNYHEKLDAQPPSMLSWHDDALVQYPRSVADTWQVTFSELNADERAMLGILSWYDHAPIPLWAIGPIWADGNPEDSRELLAGLASWHLVNFGNNGFISVHRLVQEVTRHGFPNSGIKNRTLAGALVWLNELKLGNSHDFETWNRWVPMLPHVQSLAKYAGDLNEWGMSVSFMRQSATLLRIMGKSAAARELLESAIKTAGEHLEEGDEARELLVLDFANILNDAGEFIRSAEIYQKMLLAEESKKEPNQITIALLLNNLGGSLASDGKLSEALLMFQRSLEIDEKLIPKEHQKIAYRLANLAELKSQIGLYAEAQDLNDRALSIFECVFAPNNPNIARLLTAMAKNLKAQGRLQDAIPLLLRAITIYVGSTVKHGYESSEFDAARSMFRAIHQELGIDVSYEVEMDHDEEFLERFIAKADENHFSDGGI